MDIGYKTTVFTVGSFPDKVISEHDMKNIDNYFLTHNFGSEGITHDFYAAKKIKEMLKETGQFIVLFKLGVHFPYENSYPFDGQNRRYKPSFEPGDRYVYNPQKAANSYKNALSFNLDTFFKELFSQVEKNVTYIYTSDHGQSLQEHGKSDIFTHNRNHLEQSFVPFVVVTSDAWVEQYLPKAESFDGKPLGHFSIYPTIVSILTQDRNYRNGEMNSLLAESFFPYDAFFVYGGVWSDSNIIRVSREQIDKIRLKVLVER